MFNYPGNAHFLAMSIRDGRVLDSGEKAALETELQKPKYSAKTAKECLAILHDPTGDSVVVNKGIDWPTTKSFLISIQYSLLTGNVSVPADVTQKWLSKIPSILAAYGDGVKYDLSISSVFAQITSDLIADGVVTNGAVQKFVAQFSQTASISPCEKVFGVGFFIELSDIQGILG